MNVRTLSLVSFASTLIVFFLMLPVQLLAEPPAAEPGQVRLSLNDYNRLVEQAANPKKDPRPAPAGYALGQANVSVSVNQDDSRASAQVSATFRVSVLENEWTAIPFLPPGTAVSDARVGGTPVELIAQPDGLTWGSKKAGAFNVSLVYRVDAIKSDHGYVLAIPLPQATGVNLSATLPGIGLDAAVIPAAGVTVTPQGASTQISATIPGSRGVQISWKPPVKQDQVISRASYSGELGKEAVTWKAEFGVELFNDESFEMKLFPPGVTLRDVSVDGKSSPILAGGDGFRTVVKGRGKHSVIAEFEVPVQRKNGPPRVSMSIPAIPVSRFQLKLPGKKELAVSPLASVTNKTEGDFTIATVHVPVTSSVTFSWSEAVPEEVRTELRANATLYHAIHAEEGVLYAKGILDLEVTAGETNVIELLVPADVQVNKIHSQESSVADWRVTPVEGKETSLLTVFLDRKMRDNMRLYVDYDRSIVGTEQITVPLLRAQKVNRQRGMIALLSSKELALRPDQEEKLTRVGENQLPAFVREGIEMTIAHTYKYVQADPGLTVAATTPERKQGKFDAVVNTLISLSDVTLKGAATLEVNVKSGGIEELEFVLPGDVNFLGLSAPSLRTHRVVPDGDRQIVRVEFTQEMEGQFRIEANYERIIADGQAESVVPTLSVNGAEVEQGRIAIEALAAVEVQASAVKQLSTLDASELPQQLILKTTNPILLAYKYVHVDPPHELKLKITRHKEIDVQSAAIDLAEYRTLYTRDGIAVTTATFHVRNSRKQFLRIKLPEGSQVWSATVDGRPEKPALAEGGKGPNKEVLIKIINSTRGFPISVVYQTPVSEINFLGTLEGTLPRPDMVVTRSHWSLFLPDDLSYGRPDTNMEVVAEGQPVTRQIMQKEVAASKAAKVVPGILQIQVPSRGIRYSFEKLYANQSESDTYVTIPYASGAGAGAAYGLVLLGTLLFWVGFIALVIRPESRLPTIALETRAAAGCILGGVGVLAATVGYYGASAQPALAATLVGGILYVLMITRSLKRERGEKASV